MTKAVDFSAIDGTHLADYAPLHLRGYLCI